MRPVESYEFTMDEIKKQNKISEWVFRGIYFGPMADWNKVGASLINELNYLKGCVPLFDPYVRLYGDTDTLRAIKLRRYLTIENLRYEASYKTASELVSRAYDGNFILNVHTDGPIGGTLDWLILKIGEAVRLAEKEYIRTSFGKASNQPDFDSYVSNYEKAVKLNIPLSYCEYRGCWEKGNERDPAMGIYYCYCPEHMTKTGLEVLI